MTVSSVKNLNGETFSAVQDASLTDIVSSNSANWNEISAYQANSASYLQNTDLTIVDNKITEISGVPISAGGGDVPEGVMSESGLEYNAVNEISGYNGSAIAQYGAEKQWLVHDDTLVHAANSAQYALGVNLSAVAQLLGIDETVLWSGNGPTVSTKTQDFILNESYKNFEQLQIWWGNQPGGSLRGTVITNYPVDDTTDAWQGINACSDYPNHISYKMCFLSAVSDTEFTAYSYRQAAVNTDTTANFVWGTPKQYYECYPLKIIGIGRKEV